MVKQVGRVRVNPRGFGFFEPVDATKGAISFIAPPDLNSFLDGDHVAATILDDGGGRTVAKDLELVRRGRTQILGKVVSRGGGLWIRPDKTVANWDWPLVRGGEAGQWAVARVLEGEAEFDRAVTEANVGLERVIARHSLRVAFPPACLEATPGPLVVDSRRDLRDVPTVTIDAPHSRDLDDALAVFPADQEGAMRVLVSIADVDWAVPEGGALDCEARARTTSVYLAGQVIPMLPPHLSEGALSLLPGEDRPALTVELRLSAEGQVLAIDIYESLIRSTARLSYEAVTEFLEHGSSEDVPTELFATLRWLRAAASRLGVVRKGRGGVAILREETKISVGRDGEPESFEVRTSSASHELVERLMVAANEAVATWLHARGQPAVYRIHEAPDEERVAALARVADNFGFAPGWGPTLTPRMLSAFELQYRDTNVAPALSASVLRLLGPARYTVHPGPHFGLAAPLYLHFTSPIRRYADLVVHRIVKGYLRGERNRAALDPAVEELSHHLNQGAYRAQKAESERGWMLAARHFAGRIGQEFEANVVDVRPFGIIFQLVGMGVTGVASLDGLPRGTRLDPESRTAWMDSHELGVGHRQRVRVVAANEELGRIELALCGQAFDGVSHDQP